MRNISFTTDRFYHVYNRGVEKRKIFITNSDYYRFLQILYELNDTTVAPHRSRRNFKECAKQAVSDAKRDPLVSLLSFCLMPNHFHLLLQPRSDDGLTIFMHRLGTSYAKYFNQRTERKGRLFESTFKAKEITSDAYLQHVSRYIHLNPLSLFDPHWKEKGVHDRPGAEKFLDGYRWSSYHAYLGRAGVDFIIDKELMGDVMSDLASHKQFVLDWSSRHFSDIASSIVSS